MKEMQIILFCALQSEYNNTNEKIIGRIFASQIFRRCEELCGVTASNVERVVSEMMEINVPVKEPASKCWSPNIKSLVPWQTLSYPDPATHKLWHRYTGSRVSWCASRILRWFHPVDYGWL